MTVFTKERAAQIKAVGPGTEDDLAEGQFKALISVFNTIDSYGDVVMPGAFSETLDKWNGKGDPLPVIWSHQWADLWSHIGMVPPTKAEETESGLVVLGDLDLENPTAAQAYKLMKQRRITQFSFGFDVDEGGWGTRKNADGEDREVYELRKLTLHEVGPCLVGVNRSTELLGVKGTPPSQRKTSEPERKGDEKGSAAPAISPRQLLTRVTIDEIQGV